MSARISVTVGYDAKNYSVFVVLESYSVWDIPYARRLLVVGHTKLKCAYCGMALRAVHRQEYVKYKCDTPRFSDSHGCSEDWVYEKDIAAVVLAALNHQIAFAGEAREALASKTEQLLPNLEKLRGEVIRFQRLIEKNKTDKMSLWEKYHSRTISGEAFQRENEKADEKIEKYTAKIPIIQAQIRELEMETGRENLFVERFSRQGGLQELTRKAVDEFISEIKVYASDRIEIIFNFADEYAKLATLLEPVKRKRRVS